MLTPLRFLTAANRLRLVLLLVCSFIAHKAAATHIVGGELDLQFQAGSTYRITLNLYFDALNGNPGALDQDLTVSIFEKGTNRRLQNVVLPLTTNTFVAYTNPACTQPSLSTRSLVYSRSIELPASIYNNASGYYAVVERCCRNNGINNIVLPGNAGQTFYLEFPAVVRNGQPFINSTPRIFPPLSDYACRGDLFYYNFSGQDTDKDSLVYELVTPLNGSSDPTDPKPAVAAPAPYASINWNPGLGTLNQIPGTPTLSIGRFTGRLEVRPTQIGLFVFGIKCSEYRKGEKIGEVRRDFQLKVLNCPSNIPPEMVVLAPNSRRTYQSGRDTLRLQPDSDRCVGLRFTDPNPTSRLTLSLNPVNFTGPLPTFASITQGLVRSPGAPDTLVSRLCFPACLDTKGKVFFVDVIVADDGCALPKRDTVRVAFTSAPVPNGAPRITTTASQLPLRARPGDLITFDVAVTDPENDPITLTMAGRGFQAAAVGAQLTQALSGNQVQGRFSWRVPCPTTNQRLFEFELAATGSPCADRQTTSVVIPVQVQYDNRPPTLTSDFPAALSAEPIVIRRVLGGFFEATLEGLDADSDQLTLTAAGNNFDLAAAGMSFVPTNGAGRATGIFRWEPNCDQTTLDIPLEVTFQLREATCSPVGQQRTVRFEVASADTLTFLPPNIFTPNTDGTNDYFELRDLPPNFCNAEFSDIKIFNRWGKQVYSSTSRTFRWDGSNMPAGAYYYLIVYTDKRRYKGNVTIAR
ncbi:T9SS type B sorting domain-containing protein [Hymenobacter radiodurans]|uniref:T9SS type B sorting domain-containing protein n=1 Tax=Hymenobacter radiodurans TaxID=2496028 RepID=UPI001058C2D7|nr:gliding motility-associated C-terminal domain-containing protein [Hymenobacter radiodurans]